MPPKSYLNRNEDRVALLAVLPDLNGGGAERVMLNILHCLASRGRMTSLLAFEQREPPRYSLSPLVERIDLGTKPLRHSLFGIVATIRHIRPRVIFSTLGYINIAIVALRPLFPAGSRVWIREANLPSINLPNNKHPRLMTWAYTLFYRHADLVICTSERMQKEFIHKFHVSSSRIRILPNPVDEEAIRKHAIADVLPKASGVRFAVAGRLTRQKGFDRLLEMFATLCDSTAEMIVLGEGPLGAELKLRCAQLGIERQVRFFGFVENPWAYFAVADAFLLPSRWEGMPNAALEALACGVPVVATPESGGIAELAAMAPPGAVTVAEAGEAFVAAMSRVMSISSTNLRPSLLPPSYRLASVVDTFEQWLDQDA